MGVALQKLAQEDPSFRVQTDEESGQTIISGMGELHLEIIVDRLKRDSKRMLAAHRLLIVKQSPQLLKLKVSLFAGRVVVTVRSR